jgi:hypothetical protein
VVGVGDGIVVGVVVPPAVGDTLGVTDGVAVADGMAVLVGVGEAWIGVKKTAPGGTVQDIPCAVVNCIPTSTSLKSELAFMTTGKTASPSEVVVTLMIVGVLPSGQYMVAVAVAPSTPSGL